MWQSTNDRLRQQTDYETSGQPNTSAMSLRLWKMGSFTSDIRTTDDKAAAGPRTAAIPVMSTGLMAANGPRCLQFGPRLFRQLSRQPSSSAVFREEDVLTEVNQRSRLDSTDVHRCRRYRSTVHQRFVVSLSISTIAAVPSLHLNLSCGKNGLEEIKQNNLPLSTASEILFTFPSSDYYEYCTIWVCIL